MHGAALSAQQQLYTRAQTQLCMSRDLARLPVHALTLIHFQRNSNRKSLKIYYTLASKADILQAILQDQHPYAYVCCFCPVCDNESAFCLNYTAAL